ncbi:hypothetical protein AB0C34_02710 [Nocardia sp. NPDC049220]
MVATERTRIASVDVATEMAGNKIAGQGAVCRAAAGRNRRS